MSKIDFVEIEAKIAHISQIHGCQVIVNGVYTTLKYYLRLLGDQNNFINAYVDLLKSDDSIKFEHKKAWNDIISTS